MNNESCHYAQKNRSNYVPIRNFGTSLPAVLRTDPVAYSIYRDIDSFFDEGSLARKYGPESKESMLYMAEKCSKNWDGSCELLSRNDDISKPNMGLVESPAFRHNEPGTMSIGDYLVLNSATRKFCDFNSCSMSESLYNVNDPTSPLVKSIGNQNCNPVCKPPTNPDQDMLMNKILAQPHKYTDLLLNMYYHCRNNRQAYKNTRIEQIFKLFDTFFSQK